MTIIAIGLVAGMLSNVLHEGLGHGGACLLSGGRPLVLSTVHFECSADTRLVMAGGTLVNVAAGCVLWALLRLARKASARLRFFLWLAMTINLLAGGGYFLFSGIANIGDWAAFIRGLQPAWAWHVVLTVIGLVSYALFIWFALLELRPLIGSGPDRRRRARRLLIPPYIAGGILACVAGTFNPIGMLLVGISAAAASFGGASGLLWMDNWLRGRFIPPGPPAAPVTIRRSWAWIIVSAMLSIAFIVILGPSIRFAKAG